MELGQALIYLLGKKANDLSTSKKDRQEILRMMLELKQTLKEKNK